MDSEPAEISKVPENKPAPAATRIATGKAAFRAGQVIWCLGMYASASTWCFNVVRKILEGVEPDRLQTVFAGGSEKHIRWGDPAKLTVLKTHEITDEPRVLDIARRASRMLITVRDPRDAVTSMMQAHAYSFPEAVRFVEQSASLCKSFAKDRRAKLLKYESGFFENFATVTDIAGHLGYSLDEPAAMAIFNALKRSEVERYIATLPKIAGILQDRVSGDFLDIKTQWHSHHAGRNGEIGKWQKFLTPAQVDEVMTQFKSCSDLFHTP